MSKRPAVPQSGRSQLRTPILVCLAAFVTLTVAAACGDSATEVKPAEGVIEVVALTEGGGVIPDSFVVLLNGSQSGKIASNGLFRIPFLPQGDYLVSLLEEPEECWFGTNTRMITVPRDGISYTTFLVRCR